MKELQLLQELNEVLEGKESKSLIKALKNTKLPLKQPMQILLERSYLTDTQVALLANASVEKLYFKNLKKLTEKQAHILATNFKGYGMEFSALTSIEENSAKALVKFKGSLMSLAGLQAPLTEGVARALASSKGILLLEGIKTLKEGEAKILGNAKASHLYLQGIQSLSEQEAKSLVKYKGYLDLAGLEELNPGVAKELANFKGNTLSLQGIKALSEEDLQALASCKRPLLLPPQWQKKLQEYKKVPEKGQEKQRPQAQHKGRKFASPLLRMRRY